MTRRERRTGSNYARSVWYNAYRLRRNEQRTRSLYTPAHPPLAWYRAKVAMRDLLDTDTYLAARVAAPSCPLIEGMAH